jgi:CelD/BcsL family acetyltransferase involved in cellulose biosynthesis
VIEIAQITDEDGLAGLRREWDALWRRDPAATPFQSPAWLFAWWRFFGAGEPMVLTARNTGELIGILPLYRLREPDCRKLLPIGVGLSDYVDALVDPAAPDLAGPLLAAILDLPDWDECWLPDLAPDGALARAAAVRGVTDRIMAASPCPVLALPPSSGELGRAVPRKTLRDLRQARSRGSATGGVVVETVAEKEIEAAMGDLFRLHEARWRARGEAGLCLDPLVQGFHRAAATGLQAAGMLRLYRLRIGEAVRAVYYGFVANDTAYAYLGGFDPGQPRLSPGLQIIAHALEQAVAETASRFDFLRGGETYKYAWGAVDRGKVSRHLSRRCAG